MTLGNKDWAEAAVDILTQVGTAGVLRVRGTSMAPTLRPGRKMQVEFSPGRVRVGDLLVFRQGDEMVVHRFLAKVRSKVVGPCLRTRGDGKPDLDPPLLEHNVIGRVTAVERSAGWRRLAGGKARAYAVAIAVHDHFWAVLAHVAGPLRPAVVLVDRLGIRLADALLFPLCHESCEPPGGTEG